MRYHEEQQHSLCCTNICTHCTKNIRLRSLALGVVVSGRFSMEHVFMFARLSLCALLFFSPSYGANGAPILRPRVQAELPPCEDVPGGIQNWDCYDPPLTAFPPCDIKHQNPGIDCSTDTQKPWPSPASEEKALTDISPADFASTHYIQSTSTPSGSAHHFQGMLPSCKDNWGGIPGWDCFDPPTTLLPLCDFKHQRAGFDCWPRDDPPVCLPYLDCQGIRSRKLS